MHQQEEELERGGGTSEQVRLLSMVKSCSRSDRREPISRLLLWVCGSPMRQSDRCFSRSPCSGVMLEQCNKCQMGFNLMRRKHHCRRCGHVFCDKCRRVKLETDSPTRQRVCDTCFELLQTSPSTESTGASVRKEKGH
eukprot:756044-Hanusia_phi.AAC.2